MKAFVSVYGKDRVGIIAAVSTKLAELNINIEDISQTILNGHFTMIMCVNLEGYGFSFEDITAELRALGEPLGMDISIRHEDIFNAMHRI